MDIRKLIVENKDHNLKEFPVEEWGVTVYLRSFNGHERSKILNKFNEAESKKNYYEVLALMVAMGLADEEGKRLFQDSEVNLLLNKQATVIEKLANEIGKHNGLHKEAIDEKKEN